MIVLRRERRFYVMIAIIVCAFFLYWWILKNIQTIDAPKPGPVADSSEQTDDGDEADSDFEASIVEDEMGPSKESIKLEELSGRRENLEQAKQEHRNRRDRLLVRLGDVASSLDELRSNEEGMLAAWTALTDQGLRFTETMAEDFVSIRERRSSLAENAAALAERHSLLERLVQGIGGEDVGTSMGELAARIDELDSCIDEYARECGEIAEQSQRLAQRAQDSDRGEPLDEVLSRMEAAKVSPELVRLANERESEIANEFDDYFDEMVAQTRREAQARSQQLRTENEEAARTIRQKADDAFAVHESEQQRLDAEVEAKQRTIAFTRDRARIEHYLVPFIALERTYTTPAILDDEIKEFHWANIPLEQAASLADIEATGAFESGADSFERLERFINSRLQMLDERYLPFGQHWSAREQSYLILARELLMKHGQAMVEAGLLRP